MDYKDFVSNFNRVACVMSVDLREDVKDKYIIVEANDAYKLTVVKKTEDFVTDVPYFRYIPQSANFEALCDSCVKNDRPVHTYFDIELYNAWMEVFLTPLKSDDPDKGMLLFSYEMNPKADVDKLADVSSDTAAHVLKTCLRLRETNDFQESMNAVIADIREHCGAKRCSILLTDFENRHYSLLCEDYGGDQTQLPLSAYLNEDFYRVIETWPKLIDKSTCFIITNEEDMETAYKITPEWVDTLRGDGIKTLVIFPLRSDNKTIGYIWAGNFDPSKTLMIRETLSITSFILSSEIANELNNRKMRIMSSTDLLTDVFNRNAMNNRINDDLSGERKIKRPFGIFFVDVNGLKSINDRQGHDAGDRLLKDVAHTLKELNGDIGEVYRVGGDEFMILSEDMPKKDFDDLLQRLHENSERTHRAHFAAGACYSDETDDVIKAMQKADAAMYEVKANYYLRHPEFEWHNRS